MDRLNSVVHGEYEAREVRVRHSSLTVVSWQVLLVGAFVGPIYDRGHFRALLIAGSFLIVRLKYHPASEPGCLLSFPFR